jgi:cell division protein FtsB
MKYIVGCLLLILAGLQYKLWVGDGSLKEFSQLTQKITHQSAINEKLMHENKALEADISELKAGDQALEEQARYELGMVKKDEVYYQFLD